MPSPRAHGGWLPTQHGAIYASVHHPVAPSGHGVVLCNGVGFDGLLAHRTLRVLADQFARAGIAAIRFDYHGVGDSSGGDWQPHRWNAWRDSAASVIAASATLAEVEHVHVMGFRMGALLAAHAIAMTGAVDSLSLWAPCVKGRTFTRELSALARFRAATRPEQPLACDEFAPDSLEVVGFEFRSDTLRDLAELDLERALERAPARRVLILDRDDGARSEPIATRLRTLGCEVSEASFSGYLDFMTDDETAAVMPDAALTTIVSWHRGAIDAKPVGSEASRDGARGPAANRTRATLVDSITVATREHPAWIPPIYDEATDASVIEEVALIAGRLRAVVTRPQDVDPNAVAIVLANTGSVNRCGPGRLHVGVARHWARLGYVVVRVDLGGTGDSPARNAATENAPYASDRIDELVETIAWTKSTLSLRRAVAMGVCSGAYNTMQAALDDAVADAIVLINPLIFTRTTQTELASSHDREVLIANRLRAGLTQRSWSDIKTRHGGAAGAMRRALQLGRDGAVRGYGHVVAAKLRSVGSRLGVASSGPGFITELERLQQRGITPTFVFASHEAGERYLATVGGRAFERLVDHGTVEVIRIPGGDHLFSPPGARQRLVEDLTRWLCLHHPVLATNSQSARP